MQGESKRLMNVGLNMKNNQIKELKADLYAFKDLEYDLWRLNEEVVSTEAKYAIALNQREEEEHGRVKEVELKSQKIDKLYSQLAVLKKSINQLQYEIEKNKKDNHTMEKYYEDKQEESLELTITVKQQQLAYQQHSEHLKALQEQFQAIKEAKKALHKDLHHEAETRLCRNMEELEQAQNCMFREQVRCEELDQQLMRMQEEGSKLKHEARSKQEEIRTLELKLEAEKRQNENTGRQKCALEQSINKQNTQMQELARNSEGIKDKNNQQSKNLKSLQSRLRQIENQLQCATEKNQNFTRQAEDLSKEHNYIQEDTINILKEVRTYEGQNRDLQNKIEQYIDSDNQARAILDRGSELTQLLKQMNKKLQATRPAIDI